MLHHLDVPFLDASADQLVWRLDAPPQPCLAALEVAGVGGSTLELRLLGASHQVLVHDGRLRCSEVVACGAPGAGASLPAAAARDLDGIGYRFSSEVRTVTPGVLAATAADLLRRHGGRGRALVGAFPGSDDAVTAIEATTDGWRTWHLYPQTREIVTTVTSLVIRP